MPDPQLIPLGNYFRGMRRDAVPPKELVLVQCVEDTYYFGLFGQIASSLSEKRPIRIEQYVLRSFNVAESKSAFAFLKSRLIINPMLRFKWERIYRTFCNSVAYRSSTSRPIDDAIDFVLAWKCWRNLTNKDALIKLQIESIAIGDLINDSYLRFKPAPTVDLLDRYLLILIWQAYRDIRRAKKYFERAKPKLYLTSYSTYIQHGIPVRVALLHGVRVFSFGNYQEFAKELILEDWVHTKNPDDYASAFMKLDHQDEKLALAEEALFKRMSGGVDGATAYMRKSAYAESGDTVPDVREAVVVFLHDFYDSPHVYREMVFPDFFEWACFTIETLRGAKIPFYIKPHPNQISLSDNVLGELKSRYPELSIISSGITNKQLVEAGLICAVTVYGTVAHEMAFLGVPTIACAHHPHISFDFCKTARSRNEYRVLLQNSRQMEIDRRAMHRESLIFYYMHNLNLNAEMKKLRDATIAFRFACEDVQEKHRLVKDLMYLAAHSEYQAFCDNMFSSQVTFTTVANR